MKKFQLVFGIIFLFIFLITLKKEFQIQLLTGHGESLKYDEGNEEGSGFSDKWIRDSMEFERTKDPALGYVPGQRMLRAIQYTENLKHLNIANGAEALTWTARGPIFDSVGPTDANRRAGFPSTAGYMSAVLIDTLNDPSGNTVLCGSNSGGVWKCTNFLAAAPNWSQVNDYYQTLAVTSLCQDPTAPNTMYFSTGDPFYGATFITGGGIWKSTDGGNNWVKLPGTDNFYRSFKIVCDASGNVYAALKAITLPVIQRFGLFRSKDHGNTWINITPAILTSSDSTCTDIEISSTGRLHASFGYAGTTVNHRYTDDPANVTPTTGWNTSTGIRTSSTPTAVTRMELAVAGNTLYAMTVSSTFNADSCYKSTDGGVTWTKQNSAAFATGLLNNQGHYDITLAINPDNINELIVGGLDAYKSSDGGATFATRLSYWVKILPTDSPYVHADHHFMQWWKVGTESRVVIGGDGGIFLSRDGGHDFQDRNRNLNIKQFYSCAIHPAAGSPYLLGGAQDNGTHQLKNAGLGGSYEVSGGDGGFTHIKQSDPNIQFGAVTFNHYYRSNDSGQTWLGYFLNPNDGLFTNPYDYDDGKNIMYASTSANRFIRWKDANNTDGDLAQLINAPLLGGYVSAVKLSPYTQNRIYIGSDHGKLLRIDNANTVSNSTVSANTTDITGASFTPGAYLNCVNIGSSDQYLVAVLENFGINNVWYSSDGGTSWSAIDGNLPDMPIRWALFDPQHNDKLFIATNAGVYHTDLVNGASTNWIPESGLPTVRTDMLQFRLSDNTILAGTYGRGMWTAVIPSTPEIRFSVPSLAVTEATAATTGGCRNYKDYTVNVSSVSAPTGNAIVNYTVQGGNTATPGIDFDFTTNGDFTSPSSQHTFTSGLAESKQLTIRIYDDAEVESIENFTIGFSITGSTNAIAGSAQTFSVTINDNDIVPRVLSSAVTTVGVPFATVGTVFDATLQRKKVEMLYSASELNAAGVLPGRINSIAFFVSTQRTNRAFQNMQIRMKEVGLNYLSESAIYQGAFLDLVKTIPSYHTVPGWNTFTLDSVFNWDGVNNIAIDICYNNGVADPTDSQDDIYVISNDPTATQLQANLIFQNNINCSSNINSYTYYFFGRKPQIQFGYSSNGVAIESNLNASRTEYLNGNGDEYFYSPTGQLLARIKNMSGQNYGCTQVVIDRAGTGSSPFWNNTAANNLMSKTFHIVPTSNNPAGVYQLTLYFTQAEKQGWETATGQSWNDIQLVKVSGQINQVTPGHPGAGGPVEIVTPTRGTFGNDYTLTYTFNSGFSGFGAGVAGTALPIELLDFTGRLQNNSVVLNWKTSFELNSRGFDIEKSYDGQVFEKIGYVSAKGYSNTTVNYQFNDEMIAQENNYYRLKQVDLDGKFEYSKVVLIKDPLDGKFAFRVLNNPFNTSVDIQFGNVPPGKAEVRLMDMQGKTVKTWETAEVANRRVRFNVPDALASHAFYVIKVIIGHKQYVDRIMKR